MAVLEQERRAAALIARQKREDIYRRERALKETAIRRFDEQVAALRRLRKVLPKWRKKDIEREEERYLSQLTASLADIEAQARAQRDALHREQYAAEQELAQLQLKAALTFAPAEIEAEPIEGLDSLTEEQIPDFFDPQPNQKKKKPKKVKNILDLDVEGEDFVG